MQQQQDYSNYDRKVILSKGYGTRFEKTFFEELQNLILEGWRVVDTGKREDCCMRNYKGSMGKAVLFREKMNPLDEVELLTKRDKLVEFAKRQGITVPDEMRHPFGVQKYLRTKLQEMEAAKGESNEAPKTEDNSEKED